MAEKSSVKLIANNKKAYHDYFILEKYEAGISLAGTEVKSIRMGKCSIKEAYVEIKAGQMNIVGMHISPYEKGNIFNKDPLRRREISSTRIRFGPESSFSTSMRSESSEKRSGRKAIP